MWKKAFQKLSEERKKEIVAASMSLYYNNPFESVTIRMIVDTLQINMATFYRYFDEKEDLALYIYRDIYSRFMKDDVNVFRTKIPMEKLTEDEKKFCTAAQSWPEYMHRRIVFEVECEFALPLVKASLQKERLRGNLKNNVVEDFAAYMYVTAAYNFYCYCQTYHVTDKETLERLSDYMDRDLFLHGIMFEKE